MKLFILLITSLMLTSCDAKKENTNAGLKTAFDWATKEGCIRGALEMKKKYFIKFKKDIPKKIRVEMIHYCMDLKSEIIETY